MTKADPGADGGSASLNHGLPSGPVEARSLSAITAIASNPPTYPRNPTQKKLDPLVLYIVRVPGSRGKCSWTSLDHASIPRTPERWEHPAQCDR
jgi:hypothetical protein